ncbi:MAG: 3-keto-5-aminohexanoate cleavage protein [Pseudomonadales bacterium]
MNEAEFTLPELSDGLRDAEIVQWHVAPGDTVSTGQALVSIETDKAVAEIPSPRDAHIARLCVAEGDIVSVGATLLVFGNAPLSVRSASSAAAESNLKQALASPAARQLVREMRLELEAIRDSAPQGAVSPGDAPLFAAAAPAHDPGTSVRATMSASAFAALPVIIETAINGATQPARNPHVPVTVEAITRDAIACLRAGAAIVHTHAPLGDFGLPPEQAAARYFESYRAILAAEPDALLYPTIGGGSTMSERLAHIDILAGAGVLRIGLMDPGSMILGWAGADGAPSHDSFLYINTFADMETALAQATRHRLGISLAIYEPGFLRNALVYWRLGRLPPGAMIKFYFGGDAGYFGSGQGVSFGLPPTAKALDAYLEMLQLAGCELPWSVAVMGGDLFETPVARLALERGGHLHTGLEDHLGSGQPDNVELTRRAVQLCNEVGRPVATAAQAALMLELPRITAAASG